MDDPRSGSTSHVSHTLDGSDTNGHHAPGNAASGDARAAQSDVGQVAISNGSDNDRDENLGIASMSDADREYLSEQIIGQTPLLPPREPLGARLAGFMGRRHGLLMALCALLLWAAMTLRPPGEGEIYKRGAIAKDNIYAPRAATVLDRELTIRRKHEAAALVPTEYDGNSKALLDTLAALREISAARRDALAQNLPAKSAAAIDAASTRNSAARTSRRNVRDAVAATGGRGAGNNAPLVSQASRTAFSEQLERPLPAALTTRVLQIAPARWALVERTTASAIRAAYEQGGEAQPIRSDHLRDDLAVARLRMRVAVQRARGLLPDEPAVALRLADYLVRAPNFIANQHRTERAQQEARDRVPAAYIDIRPDTLLVEAGTRIDEDTWAILEDMDLVAVRFDSTQALARLVLCIVMVGFCAGYVVRFHPQLMEQPSALWLTAMVPVAFVTIFRFVLRVPQGDQMMVPLVETGAMLLTILLNARIGLLAAFVMASLCAIMARVDSGLFLATALASSVGVLGVAEISSYRHLARGALLLAVTNAVLAGVLGTLRQAPVSETTTLALWGALAGAAAVGLTYCLAMFVERPFGITTHLRLLELSAPDEIVMRRMQSEAPGTYTHSLMVAQLGEAAAKAVGADPLLCRVGGLYHDIGKLRRPHCFVENQVGENVHDRLSPQMSALLIVAHVKDGLELGRALRLPQPVLDIIAQHHGTTLIAYFYHRAAQRAAQKAALEQVTLDASMDNDSLAQIVPANAGPQTDEALFRYPGPKPQSKEAAIVLLADTVEASSRALPNLTPERLEEHIKAMTAQRLLDGELSECELTLRDLQTIERTFAHVLRGVLHHRIEYPDLGRVLKEGGEARDWTHDTLTDPMVNARFAPAPELGHAAAENRVERRKERSVERRAAGLPDRRSQRAAERNQKSEKARSATKTALSSHLRDHGNSTTKEAPEATEQRRTDEKSRPEPTSEYSVGTQATKQDQSDNTNRKESSRGNGGANSNGIHSREKDAAPQLKRDRRATDTVTSRNATSHEAIWHDAATSHDTIALPGAHHVDGASRQSPELAASRGHHHLAANGHSKNGYATNGHARNGSAVNGSGNGARHNGSAANAAASHGVPPRGLESDSAQRGANLFESRPVPQPDAVAPPE